MDIVPNMAQVEWIEAEFGHMSPQEVISSDLHDTQKQLLAEIQMIALLALKSGLVRDEVELNAWQECRHRALHQPTPYENPYV